MGFRDGSRGARGRHMIAVVVLLLSGALSSCRPKEPLDWTVNAKSLDAFNHWMSDYGPDLGVTLQNEFALATHNLAVMTPGFRLPENPRELLDERNPFCKRINGRTVREILIVYYMASNERITGTILLNLDTLTKLHKQRGESDDGYAARSIPDFQAQIDADNEKVRRNNERLKQLRAGMPK